MSICIFEIIAVFKKLKWPNSLYLTLFLISYSVPNTGALYYGGTPLNRPPLGPVKVSLLEGWPDFRGESVIKKHALGLFEVA